MTALPIIAGIVIVTLVIILISKTVRDNFVRDQDPPGIKKRSDKNFIYLDAATPLRMSLSLAKSGNWTRALAKTSLFRVPQSGDAQFDEKFTLTLYRDDVLSIIQNNAALRKSILELTRAVPQFKSLNYSNGKLTLTVRRTTFSKNEVLQSARAAFTSAMQQLVAPFAELPPDTAEAARDKSTDGWVQALPFFSAIIVLITGTIFDQPTASAEFPWRFVLLGGALFISLHLALLLQLTKQGTTRIGGFFLILGISLFFMVAAAPGAIRSVNAWMPQSRMTETVSVQQIYQVHGKRNTVMHTYLLLANAPSQLVTGMQNGMPSLELSPAVSDEFARQQFHPHQQAEITEVTGLLGLTFVVHATAL